jgi:hypothetical protein
MRWFAGLEKVEPGLLEDNSSGNLFSSPFDSHQNRSIHNRIPALRALSPGRSNEKQLAGNQPPLLPFLESGEPNGLEPATHWLKERVSRLISG